MAEVPAPPIETSPTSLPTNWWQRKWVKTAGLVIGTIAMVYAMVYVDVVLRAKEAYEEGEKYWRWHENPELKKAELEKKFEKAKAELEKKFAKNKVTKEEYERQLEILEFDRDFQMKESAIKYAYRWYQDTYELFSPPESKWVKLAREKAPLAREKWKEELRAKKIPFEEYMLD